VSENSSATSNVDDTPGLRTIKSFTVVDLNLDVRNLRRPAENYKLFCALLCGKVSLPAATPGPELASEHCDNWLNGSRGPGFARRGIIEDQCPATRAMVNTFT
jgi:hypothetical protein